MRQNGPVAAAVRLEMLKEVGCGSSTPPPGDGAVSNRQLGGGENNNTDGVLGCGGCGREIAERWYLRAADRAWHCGCLRCCHCRVPLAAELTCFARDGNIYCKEDYYRLVQVVVRGLGGRACREGGREGGSLDRAEFRFWGVRNCFEALPDILALPFAEGIENLRRVVGFCLGRGFHVYFNCRVFSYLFAFQFSI